jgi:predicted permease
VYTAVDALLFRAPAGVQHPDTLVDIYTSQMNGGTYGDSSYPDFASIAALPELAAAAAIDERDEAMVRLGDGTVTRRVAAITVNFWDVLGIAPHVGSWPNGSAEPAAVLSFDAWQALGAHTDIVGREFTLDGQSHVVAAIAPSGFRGLHVARVVDAWIPLQPDLASRGNRRLAVVGRLAPGVGLDRLETALTAIAIRLAESYPDTNKGTIRSPDAPRRMTASGYSRLAPGVRAQTALLSTILLGVTGLLLVSACVNAGSLLLSRGIARRGELTIRTALGADRRRLMRQIVIESVILVVSGAAGGVLVAMWTSGSIPALFAPEHARLIDARIDPLVIIITLGAACLAGVVCGLAPAILSTRSLSLDVLRADPAAVGERHGGARLRMPLVAAQLAISTIFLIASGLLTSAVDDALAFDRFQAADGVVLASIETYDPSYREKASPLLRTVPSVSRAGWVAVPPMARAVKRPFHIQRGPNHERVELDVNFASPEYFGIVWIPVVDGRLFTSKDDLTGKNVVVVNEALAQRYFADRAVGQFLTGAEGERIEIVGVVRTRSYRAFEAAPEPMIYYPMSRASSRGFYGVVRSRDGAPSAPTDVIGTLRRAADATKLEVFTLDAHLARALATDRLIVTLSAACGAMALFLALIGVYGVMADLINRRTREIGLRLALGAAPRHIVGTYASTALWPVFAGVALGILGAATIVQVGRSLVYGLPAMDLVIVAMVAGGLSVSVLAALGAPIRRALRISPLVALRERG